MVEFSTASLLLWRAITWTALLFQASHNSYPAPHYLLSFPPFSSNPPSRSINSHFSQQNAPLLSQWTNLADRKDVSAIRRL